MKSFEINDLILLLNSHQDIGAQTIKKIIGSHSSERINIIQNGHKADLSKIFNPKLTDLILQARQKNISEIKNELEEKSIAYVTLFDKSYPSLLAEIPDCPAVLYVKGNYDVIKKTSFAIVGSRKYTNYGARAARKIVADLVDADITIVSGLALGIDAIAHRASLDFGLTTVGVLGCGLDMVYPSSNTSLAKSMIESGNGLIISEYPPGTPPYKSNFPARNRIIAGLTLGTIVVEAAIESGAIITAMSALDYNREVFAIPGPIDSESSGGCHKLIQQGANLICSGSDVLAQFDLGKQQSQIKAKQYLGESREQKIILDLVSADGVLADELIRQSRLNVSQVSQVLTILEMKGILENVGGLWRKKI